MSYEYHSSVWQKVEKEEIMRQVRDIIQAAKKNICRTWITIYLDCPSNGVRGNHRIEKIIDK